MDGLTHRPSLLRSGLVTVKSSSTNLKAGGLVEVAPGLPVVLGEGLLIGDNGVLLGERLVGLRSCW
jgi:hypothetical protein